MSNPTEKHILNSKRIKMDGVWYWQIDAYYPAEGHVKTILAPEKNEVIKLDAIRQ